MLTTFMLATFLAGASAPPPATDLGRETRIPRISGFLDYIPDPKKGVYIRGDTGKWYYARAEQPCPRLRTTANLHFVGTVQNSLDRYSAIIVEGWRCQLTSVVESPAPPDYGRHHTPH
jgi:hypothetical protein